MRDESGAINELIENHRLISVNLRDLREQFFTQRRKVLMQMQHIFTDL